ncbi:MAG: glycoside hydrolase family 140 protein, partial [Rhodothermales bacterium]
MTTRPQHETFPVRSLRLALALFCFGWMGAAQAQGTLAVSEDGRRIVTNEGEPFFWLGDTAWELFHRLDREEADRYLEDRARKGFNVIQAVVLAELDGLHTPNPYGHTPLIDDPSRPDEAYFEHVDYIVDKAEALGMFVGMLPTWGDKFNLMWGMGPEVFTPENARAYGTFLGERYADDPVIWILGGDRIPGDDEDLAIIRAMAEGIASGHGDSQLMTYHPSGGRQSWEWFHEDSWLDFNFYQSGHGEPDNPNYEVTAAGYDLEPVKPVLDGEPRYEDHPINWDPERGWYDAFDVRQAGYWSVLAGAAGHTYGNHNIWQMWEPGRKPISSARTPWSEALTHPGAAHVGFMKELFLSRPFLTLVPDQSVVAQTSDGARHVRAARDEQGRYLIAYTPYGWPFEVDLSGLSGADARAWWYDPRTGAAAKIGRFGEKGSVRFNPPGEGARGNDWVLVVDDASQDFPAPGDWPF